MNRKAMIGGVIAAVLVIVAVWWIRKPKATANKPAGVASGSSSCRPSFGLLAIETATA